MLKRMFVLLTVLMLIATTAAPSSAVWATSGVIQNPVANDILCDTGNISNANQRLVYLTLSATVSAEIAFEWRNAANSGNVRSQYFSISATPLIWATQTLDMQADERVRVRLVSTALLGSVQCSLMYD